MQSAGPKLVPKLIRNCRLSESPAQGDMLVMPEGAIRLKGTSKEIIVLCDGARSIDDIVNALRAKYSTKDPAELEKETLEFLETLKNKRVLDFV
jgi:pyrroloquinoline quinone biosynthesis protein D